MITKLFLINLVVFVSTIAVIAFSMQRFDLEPEDIVYYNWFTNAAFMIQIFSTMLSIPAYLVYLIVVF